MPDQTADVERKAPKPESGDSNDSRDASSLLQDEARNLMLSRVYESIRENVKTNAADSATDTQAAEAGKSGAAIASDTHKAAGDLLNHLNNGGSLKDEAGKKLLTQFKEQYTIQRNELKEHRSVALEYAGSDAKPGELPDPTGIPKDKLDSTLAKSDKIKNAAEQLGKDSRNDAKNLATIVDNAMDIHRSLRPGKESEATAGKDQKDASEEAKNIATMALALGIKGLDNNLQAALKERIIAGTQLLKNQCTDAPIEVNEANNDATAMRALDALKSKIDKLEQSPNNSEIRQQVKQGLKDLSSPEGTLKNVIADRKTDAALEPKYVEANKRANDINHRILEFSDIYEETGKPGSKK